MQSTSSITDLCLPGGSLSRRNFDQLARWVKRELGIKVGDSKISLIQNRLARRVRDLGLNSVDEYCERIFSSDQLGSERIHLYNAITTNKTDFFREPQHFSYLTSIAIPDMARSGLISQSNGLSLWSAPCSSGEEPYTLAMVLAENNLETNSRLPFRILATDISSKVLRIAQDGIYSSAQADPIPLSLRRRYLLQNKAGDLVRISPELRRTVSFHTLNFMDADYPVSDMFHVIFCRNVLIYFDRNTQEAVINKLCQNLLLGGYLFVGHSESLFGLDVPLTSLGSSTYRKTK